MKKENDDFHDFDNYKEENEKLNPWVATGIFVGMIIVAAIICGILWSFTHRDKEEESLVNTTETVQDTIEEETAWSEETTQEETVESQSVDSEITEKETQSIEATEVEPESEPVVGSEAMTFSEVTDTVTAKDVTNLRSTPSTSDTENIVSQLLNGQTLSRTGINEDTGWSRLDDNGQTVYAVSAYLTTDLTYETPVETGNPNQVTTQDGRVIIFTDCDDYVTPKEYVNLRTEPSTSQGESTVKCQISHADTVHRTGYSADSGWSRVEFYGDVLYVVSSYVYNKDATQ